MASRLPAWSPMVEPPLPTVLDFKLATCAHGYPAESCDVGVDVVADGATYMVTDGNHRGLERE